MLPTPTYVGLDLYNYIAHDFVSHNCLSRPCGSISCNSHPHIIASVLKSCKGIMSNSAFLETHEENNRKSIGEACEMQTFQSSTSDSEKLSIEQGTTNDISAVTGGDSEKITATSASKSPVKPFQLSMRGDRTKWLKIWQRVELGMLLALVVVVWGLLCLPLIFFLTPNEATMTQVFTTYAYP